MTDATRSPTSVPDVLVVGAGPVGLTTACQLARQGVAVTVVDLLEAPTSEARAAAVHARTLEMLASLQAREELESRGRHLEAMEIAHAGERDPRVRVEFDDLPSRHSTLLDVAQADTEAVLADRAVALRRAHRMKLPDAIIWATAQSEGRLLVTRNTKDFPAGDPGVRTPYRL